MVRCCCDFIAVSDLFTQKWSEFALASVLLRAPISFTDGRGYLLLGPGERFSFDGRRSFVNIIPILVLFLLLQRFLVSGLTKGAVKS